jgi:hypothetical protein
MHLDSFDRIRKGEVAYPMPYVDYLAIIDDELEKYRVRQAYERFEGTVRFLADKYRVEGDSPEIYADPLKIISARASQNKIIVSRGMVDHLDSIRFWRIPLFRTSPQIWTEELRNLAEVWIIAHEYFHIVRGHLKLLGQYYERYARGFEFDADSLAAAAVYRYCKDALDQDTSARIIRCVSLYSIFCCVRPLMQFAKRPDLQRKTHPSWEERLFFCHIKIASMDTGASMTELMCGDFEDAELLEDGIMFERVYCAQQLNDFKESPWIKYLIGGLDRTPDSSSPPALWEFLAPLVSQESRLREDVIKRNFDPEVIAVLSLFGLRPL